MIHPPCGESCGATARCEAQYEQIGKDEKRTTKKTKKRLQIKTVKENRRRKYYTFKPPSLDDFQNAADRESIARKPAPVLGLSTVVNCTKNKWTPKKAICNGAANSKSPIF